MHNLPQSPSYPRTSNEAVERALRRSLELRDAEIAELRALVKLDRNRPFKLLLEKLRYQAILVAAELAGHLSERRGKSLRRSAVKRSPVRDVTGISKESMAQTEKYHALLQHQSALRNLAAPVEAPQISLVLPLVGATLAGVEAQLAALQAQSYSNWTLQILASAEQIQALRSTDPRITVQEVAANTPLLSALNTAFTAAKGQWLARLDPGSILQPHALQALALAAESAPSAQLLYCDEDSLSADGTRYAPHFKPQWNRLLAYGQDYIGSAALIRADLWRALGGYQPQAAGAEGYDLLLRAIEQIEPSQIRHLADVLWSRLDTVASASFNWEAAQNALAAHLKRSTGRDIAVAKGVDTHTFMPLWPIDEEPLISIIIPTRDYLKVLRQAVESVLEKTHYRNFEILIVDNNSEQPETLAWMNEISRTNCNVRILRDPRPFNYSQLNNGAVPEARGEFLLLLNNDIEVISGEWLHELLAQALRPGVGCVGAKLLFPDTRIQHGGVIVGLGGVAGHSQKFFARNSSGYFNRLNLAQEYKAVTAACLLVRKSIFLEVGGLNETNLTVAFNDVDFCLKVDAAGYKNVWTPLAELFHHESISRGKENNPEKIRRFQSEIDYMKATWKTDDYTDPSYNPQLSQNYEDFRIRDV